MFCNNCGTNNQDVAKFCSKCGAKLEAAVVSGEAVSAETRKTKKGRSSKPVIAVIAAVVVLAFGIVLITSGPQRINVEDYITVEFTGEDGNGYADVDIDYDALIEKIYKGKEDEDVKNATIIIGSSGGNMMKYTKVSSSFDWDISESRKLSNGDKVTITITPDSTMCDDLDIKIKSTQLTFTVKGLE